MLGLSGGTELAASSGTSGRGAVEDAELCRARAMFDGEPISIDAPEESLSSVG